MLAKILTLPSRPFHDFDGMFNLRGVIFSFCFKCFPKFREKIIRQYVATEFDSAWQLIYAAERSKDVNIKTKLFVQALEELHHADIFSKCLDAKSNKFRRPLHFSKIPLYPDPKDFWRLFTYCEIGEAFAVKRFNLLVRIVPNGEFLKALKRVVADEEEHIGLANELVILKGVSPSDYKSAVRSIKLKRLKDSLLRIQRFTFDFICSILLYSFYFLMGPFIYFLLKVNVRENS